MLLVIIWKDKANYRLIWEKNENLQQTNGGLGSNGKEHVAEERCTCALLVPGISLLGGGSGLAQGKASAGSARLWHKAPRQVYSLYAGKSLQEHPRDCAEVPPKPNQSSILIKYGSISRSRINTKAPNNLNGYNLCHELFFRR